MTACRCGRAYRIGSPKFGGLAVVSGGICEKLPGQVPLSIKSKAADGGEIPDTDFRFSGMQTVAVVQCGV